MKIGVYSTDVSPKANVHLSGFGNPKRKFEGVHDRLYVTAVAFESRGKKFAFVGADVLGIDRDRLPSIRARLRSETGIDENAVFFCASHTHSAPEVLRGANPCVGAYEPEYGELFYQALYTTALGALRDLEEGELFCGTGSCPGIGVNRRLVTDGVYEFKPNENGVRNDEVTLLSAVCGGRLKALVYNFTCHPSTVGFDYASADYPGVARRLLSERHPGVTPLFIQGFCGNIRARTVNAAGTDFRGGTWDDIEHFGRMLADCVDTILAHVQTPVEGELAVRHIDTFLPLQKKASLAAYQERSRDRSSELNREAAQYYAEHYDHLPERIPYGVTRADFGSGLTFFALEGEVCVEYDYHLKRLLPGRHVAAAGYTNGAPGYICTAEMYRYGGYEPVSSTPVYHIPEGFDPSVEQVLLDTFKKLV